MSTHLVPSQQGRNLSPERAVSPSEAASLFLLSTSSQSIPLSVHDDQTLVLNDQHSQPKLMQLHGKVSTHFNSYARTWSIVVPLDAIVTQEWMSKYAKLFEGSVPVLAVPVDGKRPSIIWPRPEEVIPLDAVAAVSGSPLTTKDGYLLLEGTVEEKSALLTEAMAVYKRAHFGSMEGALPSLSLSALSEPRLFYGMMELPSKDAAAEFLLAVERYQIEEMGHLKHLTRSQTLGDALTNWRGEALRFANEFGFSEIVIHPCNARPGHFLVAVQPHSNINFETLVKIGSPVNAQTTYKAVEQTFAPIAVGNRQFVLPVVEFLRNGIGEDDARSCAKALGAGVSYSRMIEKDNQSFKLTIGLTRYDPLAKAPAPLTAEAKGTVMIDCAKLPEAMQLVFFVALEPVDWSSCGWLQDEAERAQRILQSFFSGHPQQAIDRCDQVSSNTSLKRLANLNRENIPREKSQSSPIDISGNIFERNREFPKSRSGENKSFQSNQTLSTVDIEGNLFTLDRRITVSDRRVEFLEYRLHSEDEGEIASFKWEGSTNYHRLIAENYRGRGLSGLMIKLGEELLTTSGERSLQYRADGIENICWGISHDYYPDDLDTRRLVEAALKRGWGGDSHHHESVGIKCILIKVLA